MQITIQVFISALIVLAVIWFMWKIPARGERFYGWAPPLALLSAWTGLTSVIATAWLWMAPFPDQWVTVVFLVLDPASIAMGVLVLWIYRDAKPGGAIDAAPVDGGDEPIDTISLQLMQARVGVTLGLLAVALGYAYVMTHKSPFTPVGP